MDRRTYVCMDGKTDRQKDRQIERWTDMYIGKCRQRLTDKTMHSPMDKQTDREKHKWTGR